MSYASVKCSVYSERNLWKPSGSQGIYSKYYLSDAIILDGCDTVCFASMDSGIETYFNN